MGRDIKNYRIWIERIEETEIIKAAVYSGMNSYENQSEENISVEIFEMREESRPLIKEWLENQIQN